MSVAPVLALSGGTGVSNRSQDFRFNVCSPLSAEMFPKHDSGNIPFGRGDRPVAYLDHVGDADAGKLIVEGAIMPPGYVL